MNYFDVTDREARTCVLPGAYANASSNNPHSTILFGGHGKAGGTHLPHPREAFGTDAELNILDFGMLCGTCRVIDCAELSANRIEHYNPQSGERIFFRTRYSWEGNFLQIPLEFISSLLERNIGLIGIDMPLSSFDEDQARMVYKPLHERGISVVEGLNLRQVDPGNYFLVTVPQGTRSSFGYPTNIALLEI